MYSHTSKTNCSRCVMNDPDSDCGKGGHTSAPPSQDVLVWVQLMGPWGKQDIKTSCKQIIGVPDPFYSFNNNVFDF